MRECLICKNKTINPKFCSNKCVGIASQTIKKIYNCGVCSKETFNPKFCSSKCMGKNNFSKNNKILCKQCKKSYRVSDCYKTKKFCSRECVSLWRSLHGTGINNPNYGKKHPGLNKGRLPSLLAGRGKVGFRDDINHFVRSTWEANFARFLQFMKIDYEYEKHRFKLSNDSAYSPDFFIKDSGLFIEIKGYMDDKSKEKIKLFRKEYPQYKLKILGVNEYPKFKEIFHIFRIKGWEK